MELADSNRKITVNTVTQPGNVERLIWRKNENDFYIHIISVKIFLLEILSTCHDDEYIEINF